MLNYFVFKFEFQKYESHKTNGMNKSYSEFLFITPKSVLRTIEDVFQININMIFNL